MSTVGIPKEIKDHESRVAITVAGVEILRQSGHRILIERGAGEGSGISDEDFSRAGAEIVDLKVLCGSAEIIAKVKEPQPSEYECFHEGQTLFTYFHFAGDRNLTDAMIRRKVTCIAYETVQLED